MSDELQRESDIELEEIPSETEDAESTPETFEIATYPADFILEVLDKKWKAGEIDIPPFQRQFVWKLPQAARLIESFMMGLPVPQIFLYTGQDQKLLVIDGQQRLRSVSYFFEGYFGEASGRTQRRVFRLSNLNEKSRWFNKTFDEFDDSDKRKLKNSVLRAIIVRQLDPNDDTSVYHIFERLNTGGTLLTGQEIRNCVYHGRLNDFLVKLNDYKRWRDIVGRTRSDSHQRDVELILRYLALFHDESRYFKPMKDFLSSFMRRNKNPSEEFLSQEERRFKTACETVIACLGERPFRPRTTLNAAVFDSVFTAFARHQKTFPTDIEARYKKLIDDPSFDGFTRAHTTDPDGVHARIEMAERILFE